MKDLDHKDIQLLRCLQKNALVSSLELSEQLNMSASQIGRRRQRLESEGYIQSTPCRLNAKKLGLNVQAFIHVQTVTHSDETHGLIETLIRTRAEIVSVWTLTGEEDYLFRVFCEDLEIFNDLVQHILLPHKAIARVQSQIVMEQLKDDTALPLR